MFRAFLNDSVRCFDANAARRMLAENGKPGAGDLGKATSFVCPVGPEPAKAWVLLRLAQLNLLDLDGEHSLTFEYVDERSGQTQTLKWYRLVVTKEPLNLSSPYQAGDPDALYLVELADARWRVRNPHFCVPINAQYNVRAPAYHGAGDDTKYYADSLNAGAAWTWAEMVESVWNVMEDQLGTFTSLPDGLAPHGTPEGWVFQGVSAWEALCAVLRRIGCVVRADLTSPDADAQYRVVQVGAPDGEVDEVLLGAAGKLIHDGEYLSSSRGRIPAGVRVFFHRQEEYAGMEETTGRDGDAWQPNSVHSIDVANPESGGEPGVYTPVWDDLPAIYDHGGTLTNATDLQDRAFERAADYFRALKGDGGGRYWKVYSGLLAITPGSTLKGSLWKCGPEVGAVGGVITQVVRHATLDFKAEGGQLLPLENSARTQPPSLRPTHPVYPPLLQVVEVGAASGDYYSATVQKHDPEAGTFADKESVWIKGVGSGRAMARLAGYRDGRPLYLVGEESLNGGSATGCGVTVLYDATCADGAWTETPVALRGSLCSSSEPCGDSHEGSGATADFEMHTCRAAVEPGSVRCDGPDLVYEEFYVRGLFCWSATAVDGGQRVLVGFDADCAPEYEWWYGPTLSCADGGSGGGGGAAGDLTVTLAGIADGTCADCEVLNDTFTLAFVADDYWEDRFTGPCGEEWVVSLGELGGVWTLSVGQVGGGGDLVHYDYSGSWDRASPLVLTQRVSPTTGQCDSYPADVTVNPA